MRWPIALMLLVAGCADGSAWLGGNASGDDGSSPSDSGWSGADPSDTGSGGDESAGQAGGGGSGSTGLADDMPEQADDALPHFADEAALRGIDQVHDNQPHGFATPGQAWADIDRDGFLDVVLTNQLEPNRVFMGGPGGQFSEPSWAADIALTDQLSSGAVFADVDNDGWPDLYILAFGPNTLLRNLGGQGFVDISATAGIDDPGVGETAAWGDYDNDGLLDVYVVNNDIASPDPFYHNEGNGIFTEVSQLLALDLRAQPSFSASWFDYDLDNDLDLYVANDKRVGNILWRNDGPGCGGWCLTDVSVESGADIELCSMGVGVGDYDNDGDQDLFISSVGDMGLLQNQTAQGTPEFIDVAAEANALVEHDGWGETGWGPQFLDFDNDGWLDLYVGLGKQDPGPQYPNILLHNLHDGSFARLEDVAGAADPRLSFSVALADFDADGWMDISIANSGAGYGLFHNGGGQQQLPNHHLEVSLRADVPGVNYDGIGARVIVFDDQGGRQVRQVIAGTSLGAGTSSITHFGLGQATASAVHVVWPDGHVQQWANPPTDAVLLLQYGP